MGRTCLLFLPWICSGDAHGSSFLHVHGSFLNRSRFCHVHDVVFRGSVDLLYSAFEPNNTAFARYWLFGLVRSSRLDTIHWWLHTVHHVCVTKPASSEQVWLDFNHHCWFTMNVQIFKTPNQIYTSTTTMFYGGRESLFIANVTIFR